MPSNTDSAVCMVYYIPCTALSLGLVGFPDAMAGPRGLSGPWAGGKAESVQSSSNYRLHPEMGYFVVGTCPGKGLIREIRQITG